MLKMRSAGGCCHEDQNLSGPVSAGDKAHTRDVGQVLAATPAVVGLAQMSAM